MSEAVHPVPDHFHAKIGPDELQAMRDRVASDPGAFWLDQAKRLDWTRFPTEAGDCDALLRLADSRQYEAKRSR